MRPPAGVALVLMLGLAALAFGAAGCGSDDTSTTTPRSRTVPEPPPTPVQLAQIRSTPQVPLYWLGPRFDDKRLTRANLTATDPPDAIFQYGTPTCDAVAGCSYPLGVATVREREPAGGKACWDELGQALVLACAGSESLQIYTGTVEVFVRAADGNPLRAARALRVKMASGTGRAVAGAFPAPRPFSCDQIERFAPAFRAALPAPLRPTCG